MTAIKDRDGPCPRGNDDGCGVCSTVDENFLITEEKGLPVGKDTSLMVESGAVRVYWMRVLHEHLAEGVAELMRRVGSGAICIGESNSLRTVVEPDLFIIARDRKATSIKPSSRAVLHLAHRVVLSDTRGVDISLDDFDIEGGEWTLS